MVIAVSYYNEKLTVYIHFFQPVIPFLEICSKKIIKHVNICLVTWNIYSSPIYILEKIGNNLMLHNREMIR